MFNSLSKNVQFIANVGLIFETSKLIRCFSTYIHIVTCGIVIGDQGDGVPEMNFAVGKSLIDMPTAFDLRVTDAEVCS